jgi:hypothetical protein
MMSRKSFRVEVNDKIVVTLRGSHYSVAHYKPEGSPQLLARRISDRDDPRCQTLERVARWPSLRKGRSYAFKKES